MLNDDMVQLDQPYEPEEPLSPLDRLDFNVARFRAAVSGRREPPPRLPLSPPTAHHADRTR